MKASALLMTVSLALVGCKQQGQKTKPLAKKTPVVSTGAAGPKAGSKGSAAALKGPAKGSVAPGSSRSKVPTFVQRGPLAKESLKAAPAAEIIKKLRQAHYDPVAQGLQSLNFSVTFQTKKTETKVEAEGSWKRGGQPLIKVKSVTRKGKSTKESRYHQQIGKALTLRLQRLLRGLGRGFLSARFSEFIHLPDGKVERKKDGLSVSYVRKKGEFPGETLALEIGPGYELRSLTRRSSRGITRSMQYEYKYEQGRNLVQRARLHVAFDKGAQIPQKARITLTAANKSLYQLNYSKVGRFMLPASIYKKMPGMGESYALELRYSAVQ